MQFLKQSADRPPFEKYYILLLVVFIGWLFADLAIVYVRPMMLPTKPPPPPPVKRNAQEFLARDTYNPITDRNIFSIDGVIPPPLSSGEQKGSEDAPAVLSQLPLKLEGTIVHVNPKKSVATIQMKSGNATSSFQVDEDIESMARITKIERRKVTFRNLNNNRMEYIEIPKDGAINFGMHTEVGMSVPSTEVEKRGEFDFAVKRSDITKYTSDLSSILNQARMVPNIVPGSGGRVEGFRFVSIQPGSIYEKLGFKPGDIIKGVDGEPVNSPTKAMELYNALKSNPNVKLGVERNGREENFSYTITE